MIKLVEHYFCDICNVDLGHARRSCQICARVICNKCYRVLRGPDCSFDGCKQCEYVIQKDSRMITEKNKFLGQWKLISIKEHDLQKLP